MEPFMGMLESMHTKRTIYVFLAIGTLVLSLIFSYRAAVVYFDVLTPVAGTILATIFAIVVFMGISIGEMVSAIHWVAGKNWRNYIIIGIVVLHDGGGVFYTIFGQGGFKLDAVKLVIFVSMTVVSGLPFLFGYRMHEIAPDIQHEIEEVHENWIERFGFRMERRGAKLAEKNASRDKKVLIRFAPPSILATIEAAQNGETGQVNAIPNRQQPRQLGAYPARVQVSEARMPVGGFPKHPIGYNDDDEVIEEDTEADALREQSGHAVPFQRGRDQR